MADVTRTFLAVPVPAEIVEAVERLRRELEPEVEGVRWVASDQYHLTLAFLGDVRNADLETIGRAAGEAAGAFEPFALRAEGLGAFPDAGRMRVLWVGMEGEGVGTLKGLQERLVEELGKVGYRPEDERFTPHLTLARFKPRAGRGRAKAPDVRGVVERFGGWSGGTFRAEEVAVFRSILRPEGPSYQALERKALGREKRGNGA